MNLPVRDGGSVTGDSPYPEKWKGVGKGPKTGDSQGLTVVLDFPYLERGFIKRHSSIMSKFWIKDSGGGEVRFWVSVVFLLLRFGVRKKFLYK